MVAAEKELGIDNAEASKQQEIDRANKVESSTYTDTYDEAIGDAKLTFATAIADATLTWQNVEATSQQIFTTSSVPLDGGGFFSKVNAAWVDDAVRRGDDILVVSARKHMFDSSGKLTGFGKEVDRLINVHGYRWNSGFTRLLPPG